MSESIEDFVSLPELIVRPDFLARATQLNYTLGTVVLKSDTPDNWERVEVTDHVGRIRFWLLMRYIERCSGRKWERWYNDGPYKMYGPKEEEQTRLCLVP